MKKITINGVEYDCMSNALTRLHYKKLFGVGLFQDISKMTTINKKQVIIENQLKAEGLKGEELKKELEEAMLEYTDDLLDIVERFAYVLIYTANPNFKSFEEWLSEESMATIDFESGWIQEVSEYLMSTFRR